MATANRVHGKKQQNKTVFLFKFYSSILEKNLGPTRILLAVLVSLFKICLFGGKTKVVYWTNYWFKVLFQQKIK